MPVDYVKPCLITILVITGISSVVLAFRRSRAGTAASGVLFTGALALLLWLYYWRLAVLLFDSPENLSVQQAVRLGESFFDDMNGSPYDPDRGWALLEQAAVTGDPCATKRLVLYITLYRLNDAADAVALLNRFPQTQEVQRTIELIQEWAAANGKEYERPDYLQEWSFLDQALSCPD